jgi:uncharacterized protein YbjT (DUF2867 family)
MRGRRVLLTGATGFVGRRLWPALVAAGGDVRCLTRDADRARRRWPERHWVGGDVGVPASLDAALAGCDAAYYLVHGMADGGGGFRAEEVRAARTFAAAAARAGVRRIVYLGGLAPRGVPSEHLASRLEVGRVLGAGRVPAVELRASMIVGHGSLSWQIVRDLAARLPVMVLPRWLRSRTQPVAIADVVVALARALDLDDGVRGSWDLPGPDTLSAADVIRRTAVLLGLRPPRMLHVPLLSPRLSSHWLRLVSGADWAVARELVAGLREDLLARDAAFWALVAHEARQRFDEAGRHAIAEERREARARGFWAGEERVVARLRAAAA